MTARGHDYKNASENAPFLAGNEDDDDISLTDFNDPINGHGIYPSSGFAKSRPSLLHTFMLLAQHVWQSIVARLKNLKPTKEKSLRQKYNLPRRICNVSAIISLSLLSVIAIAAIFFPSYTNPPEHYTILEHRIRDANEPGRANVRQENIFIAAILYDPGGDIVNSAWGKSVLELIDLLGPENTFLSIFESDSGPEGAAALQEFELKVTCDHRIESENIAPIDGLEIFKLPDGDLGVKRVAYLASARNRALEPLKSSLYSGVNYDKILYLNDVLFSPIEAAHLLFSTNLQEDGRTGYRAACGMDFVDGIKYYDTFATRDAEGYSLGLPLYPWFSSAGNAQSRRDILQQSDHVQVQSCWGGIVAFDAAYFQQDTEIVADNKSSVSFRGYPDHDREASECCLIHADLLAIESGEHPTGIYMNPYVRVAYAPSTFAWLDTAKRFERLLYPLQVLVNHVVGLPWFNNRRTLAAGDMVTESVWSEATSAEDGSIVPGKWDQKLQPALPGSYCGTTHRSLMFRRLKQDGRAWADVDYAKLRTYPSAAPWPL